MMVTVALVLEEQTGFKTLKWLTVINIHYTQCYHTGYGF